jgi:hypothetical protein
MFNSAQAKGFAIGLLVNTILLLITGYMGVAISTMVISSIILSLIIAIATYMVVLSNAFQTTLHKIHEHRGSYEL